MNNLRAIISPSFPESLRAISLHAPHAVAIVKGIKKAEFRAQPTKRWGWVLIHSSGSTESDCFLREYGLTRRHMRGKRKAIIGAVRIMDCYEVDWGYAYALADPIEFLKPIAAKGQSNIFWTASTPEQVLAFNEAWKLILEHRQPIQQQAWMLSRV